MKLINVTGFGYLDKTCAWRYYKKGEQFLTILADKIKDVFQCGSNEYIVRLEDDTVIDVIDIDSVTGKQGALAEYLDQLNPSEPLEPSM